MQNIERKILKMILKREFFNQYGNQIGEKVFSGLFHKLYTTIRYLHSTYEVDLTTSEVIEAHKAREVLTETNEATLREILDAVDQEEEINAVIAADIIKAHKEKELARQTADIAIRVMNGQGGTLDDIKELLTDVSIESKAEYSVCSTELGDLYEILDRGGSFPFAFDLLQEHVPGPGRQDFMIVFASTNTGKSSFVAQNNVGYLQQGLKVLYFANEERAPKIMMNHIRSCEGKNDYELRESGKALAWGKIKDKFYLIPAHDMDIYKIETIIAEKKPDVVVIDQLDNVRCPQSTEGKLHQTLGMLYARARVLAAKYNCLMVAVSQASDSASGKMVLHNHMMANSKVDKPGTADLIIGIGKKEDDRATRCISVTKNKLNGWEDNIYCTLNYMHCRYER